MAEARPPAARPTAPVPNELSALIAEARRTLHPVEFWLFGSRARGDWREDSDWDVLAVLPDDAPARLLDPLMTWEIRYRQDTPVTLLSTTKGELDSIWGLPNTLGYDLAREGVRLVGD